MVIERGDITNILTRLEISANRTTMADLDTRPNDRAAERDVSRVGSSDSDTFSWVNACVQCGSFECECADFVDSQEACQYCEHFVCVCECNQWRHNRNCECKIPQGPCDLHPQLDARVCACYWYRSHPLPEAIRCYRCSGPRGRIRGQNELCAACQWIENNPNHYGG